MASLNACSFLPDHSLDYLQAKTLPPLEKQTTQRDITALYVIPNITTPVEQAASVIKGEGRKREFVVPAPHAMTAVAESTPAIQPLVGIAKPQMMFDGNSVPQLMVAGNRLQIWEQLGAAIQAAKMTLTDRNQSLGLYYLEVSQGGTKESFLLKLTPTTPNNIVSVQKDSDTLADAKLSQQILLNLLKHWPS